MSDGWETSQTRGSPTRSRPGSDRPWCADSHGTPGAHQPCHGSEPWHGAGLVLSDLVLVRPPVAPALDVLTPTLAEAGRADDEDLQALRAGLVAAPRTGRDAHRVPLLEVDDLVVDLHPSATAHDHVHLLLLGVRVAVRKAISRRDA